MADPNNTSATGGYLAPGPLPQVLEGADLENFWHDVIAGITGLANELVRPAFQPEPPNIPVKGTVWCAFRFVDEDSDTSPAVVHNGDNDGSSELQRQETFGIVCSFYGTGAGSDAKATAKVLRDGLVLDQNREILTANYFGIIEVTAPIPAPALIKETWLYRCDSTIRVRRMVSRTYQIMNIDQSGGFLEEQTSQPELITIPFNAQGS